MTEEQKNVMATISKMTGGLETGNIDQVMATYEDAAVVLFEPGDAVGNKVVMRQIFQEMAAIKPEVSYAGHEVYIAGDTAIHLAPWQLEGTAPDGTKIEQGGLSVAVLKRQADGSWKMVIDNPHGARLMAN